MTCWGWHLTGATLREDDRCRMLHNICYSQTTRSMSVSQRTKSRTGNGGDRFIWTCSHITWCTSSDSGPFSLCREAEGAFLQSNCDLLKGTRSLMETCVSPWHQRVEVSMHPGPSWWEAKKATSPRYHVKEIESELLPQFVLTGYICAKANLHLRLESPKLHTATN